MAGVYYKDMSYSKELPQPETKKEASESFGQRFGQILEGEINGLLEEKFPGFSEDGISPKEKNLYRATLTFRILAGVVTELARSSQGGLAQFFTELVEKVAAEHAEIYDSLCDQDGNLPPNIEEKLLSIRKEF